MTRVWLVLATCVLAWPRHVGAQSVSGRSFWTRGAALGSLSGGYGRKPDGSTRGIGSGDAIEFALGTGSYDSSQSRRAWRLGVAIPELQIAAVNDRSFDSFDGDGCFVRTGAGLVGRVVFGFDESEERATPGFGPLLELGLGYRWMDAQERNTFSPAFSVRPALLMIRDPQSASWVPGAELGILIGPWIEGDVL